MPRYEVKHYNGESGFLHSRHEVYAADAESAEKAADALVNSESGYGVSADGAQAIMPRPRFRTAVQEME